MENKINAKIKSETALSCDGKGVKVVRVMFNSSLLILNAFLNAMEDELGDLMENEEFYRGYKILRDFYSSCEKDIIGDRNIYDSYSLFELLNKN